MLIDKREWLFCILGVFLAQVRGWMGTLNCLIEVVVVLNL